MKLFFSKKGMNEMWWIIAAAIIAILVVIFLVIWFKGSGGSAFDFINKQIGGLGDEDGDGVTDAFDKCSGTPGGAKVDARGCPTAEQRIS